MVKFSKSEFRIPKANVKIDGDSVIIIKPYAEADIYYSLNGVKPTRQNEKYHKAIPVRDGDNLKFITTSPSGRMSKYESGIE